MVIIINVSWMQNQTNRKGIYNHTFVKNKFGVVEVKYDKIDDGKEAQIF